MRIEIGKDEQSWTDLAWTWVNSNVPPGSRVFLPAGQTPLPLYRRWTAQPKEHLRSLQFVQIDDILTGPQRGHFQQFFQDEMKPFLAQFEWIDRADQRADVAILGVGLNGHVAFHEPGLSARFFSGCVPLSETTKRHLKLQEPTWGITYGVSCFLDCKKILVLARGESKKAVLAQATKDSNLPISWILKHPQVTLITDFSI